VEYDKKKLEIEITLPIEDNILLFLPGDVVSANGVKCFIKEVHLIEAGKIKLLVESDIPIEGEVSFSFESISNYGPWYQELCDECYIKDCNLCKELCGWTNKKFACIGDFIQFDGDELQIIGMRLSSFGDLKEKILEVKTSPVECWIFLDDPFVKITRRGPLRCLREGTRRNPGNYCNICFKHNCTSCVLKGA
jgi:hypothetical protein